MKPIFNSHQMFSNQISHQKGIGLLEVMVALSLLAIAVLGYAGMQVRSAKVGLEADNNTRAVEFARDLHERMRINREGTKVFENAYTTKTAAKNCRDDDDDNTDNDCTPEELARFDFSQVATNAESMAMDMAVRQCPLNSTSEKRHCIFVAWGKTTPTIGAADTDCISDTLIYAKDAQCIFMESFSYAKP